MRKIYLLSFTAVLLVNTISYSQSTTGNTKNILAKWKTDPFDQQVFIENNGQFDDKINSSERILYGAQLGKVSVYFTADKVIYRYDKILLKGKVSANADNDDVKNLKHEVYFLSAAWEDANKSVTLEASDKRSDYYTYGKGSNGTIKASIFKRIIYKDIYRGVDAEYRFIKGKQGMKYSIIIHPGADMSKIKIAYKGVENISKNEEGDIIIDSKLDELTEHAPLSNYSGEVGKVNVSSVLNGNTESFIVSGNYDKSKTLIIDPWVTDPLFSAPGWDRAYDLDWDYHGNVYAYGGNVLTTMQFVKINSAGVIQWTYNASYLSNYTYGDFCTDKKSGSSYLLEAHPDGNVAKVSTNGTLLGIFSGNMDSMSEQWRAAFDECHGVVVIGGGGNVYDNHNQAATLDTDLSSMHWVNVLGLHTPLHDISLLALDPNGRQCYMYSAKTIYAGGDNMAMQLPLPTLSPTAYQAHEQLGFYEVASITYTGSFYGEQNANGMNGAAASPNWLYLYNGDTVRRYNKNTGVYVSGKPIRAHAPFRYGGIDVDACDNLFVGVADSLYILDSTYATKTIIPLHDTVYDVHLGQNGAVYACGKGFVTQLSDPIPPVQPFTTSFTYPSSCSACNATATINPTCGIAPFAFLWSNGNTNETDTGLCAGVYSFKMTNGACPPQIDSGTVIINGKAGYTASVSDTNPGCVYSKGNITSYPSGGSPPYTYKWSNGETTQKDTGLAPGTYTCTITDITGCKTFVIATLINTSPPFITVSPSNDTICSGNNVTLNASGGVTYNWSPHAGLSCYNCPSPTASPLSTTTYTVVGTDGNGCKGIDTAIIKVISKPKITITGKDSICPGTADTLTVSGGRTYIWSNLDTASTIIINPATTETISVTAYNGLCSSDTTFTIYATNPVSHIVAGKDSICLGETDTLKAFGGGSYRWSNQSTSTSIIVSPNTSTTYTLYVKNGTCSDSTTINIGILKPLSSSLYLRKDSICSGDTANIAAIVTGAIPTSYTWSTGSTASSISVTPAVTTTYTSTVYGKCDTVSRVITVTVVPRPILSINYPNECENTPVLIQANVTGQGPFTYLWSPGGQTLDTLRVKDTIQTYTVSVTNVCSVVQTFTLIPDVPVLNACCDKTIIAGDDTTIVANGNGIINYQWLDANGVTCLNPICDSVRVNPTVTTTYTVIGTDTLGCEVERIITIVVEQPCADFNVPNVFTPANGGSIGIDKVFYINTGNVNSWSINIYNRWGQELFKTTNPSQYWDGNTESGGQAPAGVYYYIINATCHGSNYKKDGFVQLIR